MQALTTFVACTIAFRAEPALAFVRQASPVASMETTGWNRACIPMGVRPRLDRRLGCDVVRANGMVSAIAIVAANITGATTNANVVLVAMISGSDMP